MSRVCKHNRPLNECLECFHSANVAPQELEVVPVGSWWMLWDGVHNVTSKVAAAIGEPLKPGAVFATTKEGCEYLKGEYNVK